MLTIDEVDNIVAQGISRLDQSMYEVKREERGQHSILYTVYKRPSDFLGSYVIMPDEYGMTIYKSNQYTDDQEWDNIHLSLILPLVKKAEQDHYCQGWINGTLEDLERLLVPRHVKRSNVSRKVIHLIACHYVTKN